MFSYFRGYKPRWRSWDFGRSVEYRSVTSTPLVLAFVHTELVPELNLAMLLDPQAVNDPEMNRVCFRVCFHTEGPPAIFGDQCAV